MKELRFAVLLATLTASLFMTGCLTSRLQMKEEEKDTSKPVPAQVQEVQPQGQYVIDELRSEITRLTGRLEDMERARQSEPTATAAQKEETKKLETRIAELENAQLQLLEVIKKMQESKPAAAESTSEVFEKAKSLFDSQQFDNAIESFNAYLKNPKAPKSEDATFLRAESHFNLKNFKKAIVDYSRFPEKFTKSRHMPSALLRIGQSFEALGMKDDAKGFYQELVDKFPKSAEAKKAKARLK